MLIVKTSIGAGGAALNAPLLAAAHAAGAYIGGGFALEQGFLYSAMIWSAIVVCIVDREWHRAAVWCGIGGLLALTGLMHSYALTGRDTVIRSAIAGVGEWAMDFRTVAFSRGRRGIGLWIGGPGFSAGQISDGFAG